MSTRGLRYVFVLTNVRLDSVAYVYDYQRRRRCRGLTICPEGITLRLMLYYF